jgi:hypothetical protein
MPRTQIAESILSLFTTHERAASTIGDLMEDRAARGSAWFWTSVCRTALALLWSAFTVDRSFFAAIALRGLLLNNFILSFGYLFVLLAETPFGALPMWVYVLIRAQIEAAAYFFTGRFVSRRAPGREIAASLAMLIAQAVFELAGLVLSGHWRILPSQFTPSGVRISDPGFVHLEWMLALVLGAVQIRWKRQSAG